MANTKDCHVQCTLERGNVLQISWIPEKYAKKGNIIDLKESGKWDKGWKVVKCCSKELTKKVLAREKDHQKMRLVTDI